MRVKIRKIVKEQVEYLTGAFMDFFQQEAASGIVLLLCAAVAMVLANSPLGASYEHLLHQEIVLGFSGGTLSMSLLHWINDGLMAVFFFVIGMEIKREFLFGELKSLSATILPIAAAIGGMVVPALIYVLLNLGQTSISGWGIPMATDIAFALGVLAFAAKQAPRSIAIFLTALAIVDDLGGILVIAFFYTEQLNLTALLLGFAVLFLLGFLAKKQVEHILPYLIGGLLVWYAFLQAGIHPTIAGVLLVFLLPAGTAKTMKQHLLYKAEHALEPWSAYLIMPVFALGNAGISLDAGSFSGIVSPIGLGVILGLCLGKPLGIFLSAWLLIRLKLVKMPEGVRFVHFAGAGILGGIGFTMSLFIASLAFANPAELMTAKTGIVCASLLAGVSGILFFKWIAWQEERNAVEGECSR